MGHTADCHTSGTRTTSPDETHAPVTATAAPTARTAALQSKTRSTLSIITSLSYQVMDEDCLRRKTDIFSIREQLGLNLFEPRLCLTRWLLATCRNTQRLFSQQPRHVNSSGNTRHSQCW